MGVIQNSLNQALVTVAGSLIGAKHISQQAKQIEINERNERAELEQEVPKLKYETLPALEEQVQTLETAHQRVGEDLDRKLEEQGYFSAADARNATNVTRALKIAQGQITGEQLKIDLKESRLNELREKQDKDIGGRK